MDYHFVDEQIEDLYEMLLLFKEGLFHVKNDTPKQGMRPLYRAWPPHNKQAFCHLRKYFIPLHSE